VARFAPGEFLRVELGSRPGRLRASLRITAACAVGTVLVLGTQMPHASWVVFSIVVVSQSDAGASLRRGFERLLGTAVGGVAALLAVMALVDLPYAFFPFVGVAVAIGIYLSRVLAAPYPPLLGTLTFLLVALSHVEYPEDHVAVALWRILAIALGVVVGTSAQLFLWPDDPLDKLRAELVRRFDLVRSLIDRALAPAAAGKPPVETLALGDLTTQLQLLANAEILHPGLRRDNAAHTALILEVARLFTAALWAAETTPATAERAGLDEATRRRLLAIRDGSARFARALEGRRSLLADVPPTAPMPQGTDAPSAQDAEAALAVAAQEPVLASMERSLDRIAYMTGAAPSGRRLLAPPVPLRSGADAPPAHASRLGSLDIAALKIALKAALGVELCYLLLLGFAWPGIVTCTITCVIVAQSTVGATVTKAILRQVGAILGGVLGLIVIVVLMPNLHNFASFLVVMAGGYWIASWITVGGPRTAYAGIQTALAFGIMLLSSFGPTTDLLTGRDRVIGILLGAAVMGMLDLTIWPVQARSALRPTLASALRMMAALARVGTGGDASETTTRPPLALRARIYHTLSSTLALRDESRMEGDPDTPATRAESDMILHMVADALAVMPGLLAGAGQRLASAGPLPRTAFADHVQNLEATIAGVLDATADSVEGRPSPEFAPLRERAGRLADAEEGEPDADSAVGTSGDTRARLESRHVMGHQLLRLVSRLGSDSERGDSAIAATEGRG